MVRQQDLKPAAKVVMAARKAYLARLQAQLSQEDEF